MKKTSELIWQDTQHQVLFELIEQLKYSSDSRDIFYKLTNYTENHFAIEETYMRELNFPGIDEHISAHNRFRTELQSIITNPKDLDKQIRETISIFLKEWLTRHVFGIDKDLEEFILNSSSK